MITASMRAVTVRTRMLALAILAGLALLAVAGVGILAQMESRQASTAFINQEFKAMTHIARLRTTMATLRAVEKDMIIAYGKADKVTALNRTWATTYDAIRTSAAELDTLLTDPAQKSKVAEAVARLDRFVAKFQPVAKMLATDGYDSPLSAASFMARAQSEYDEAQKVIASLAEDIEQSAANGGKRLATFADLVVKVLAGVAIAALAIVMPVTLLNVKSVVDPLREAETLAERIGAGDLSEAKIDLRGKDEPARLLNALDAMRQSLTGIVSTIRNSTESIHNASSEIAIGNQDLSVRTEQTAASLQQAASSMEQLTATVRGSADSAKEANKLAGRAADIAQQGGQVMTAVVDTMERIKGSSRKISDIISVIDGIAFQTNILALNAAVEAARAGNAGRGFSVVASEVRALAQRSAQAAREIKDLIEESVNHVREGTEKVSVAGVTMQEIVGAVERVSAIVNEIRTSADEQSDTIGAVNDSVSQLDRMTQQNAALVEESAAAAESLKDQASMLTDSVDIFKLAPDGGCIREKESMAHAHKDSRYEAQPQQLFTAGRQLAYPA